VSLTHKTKPRADSALNPIDLTALAKYREDLEKRAEVIERKNRRTWYSKPRNETGVACMEHQKIKGHSIPLI
jgi:hypothetical protein